MIIKREKMYTQKIILALCLILAVCCVYIFGMKVSLNVFLLLNLPVFLLYGLAVLAEGRTFILDAEGCTVCFLWFRKKYLWSELQTKKMGDYPKFTLYSRGDCPYRRGVLFAPFRIRCPHRVQPIFYSILHPWAFVYINFYIPDPVSSGRIVRYQGRRYEVHEEEFREKMKQWHVELEEWNT